MSKFVELMRQKDNVTDNGAITNSTSLSACLDLFFLCGACRQETEANITRKIAAAYQEDRITCLKIIFWAGDIRQGAGERRFFEIALRWLAKYNVQDLEKYCTYVPEFSRWDVLFNFVDNKTVMDLIINELTNSKDCSLLCKWLPRKNQYNNLAQKIQKRMNWSPKQYRKYIVSKTKVVEQKMCSKKWNEIEYFTVPSVAFNKYNKAWYRNDKQRFEQYIQEVQEGKSKINASAIFPHDIIKRNVSGYTIQPLTTAQVEQWNSLPNWLEGKENSIIPVCDVSGSMYNPKDPIAISIALGLYISERNTGPFKDAIITFSEHPKMNYLDGSIATKINQLENMDWGQNTNLQAVFDLILKTIVDNNLTEKDVPETLLIISDMQFDIAVEDKTNFEAISEKYKEHGIKMPNIVFWNVNGHVNNVPISKYDKNTALISGASPAIVKTVLQGEISPLSVMNQAIQKSRYSFIQ